MYNKIESCQEIETYEIYKDNENNTFVLFEEMSGCYNTIKPFKLGEQTFFEIELYCYINGVYNFQRKYVCSESQFLGCFTEEAYNDIMNNL